MTKDIKGPDEMQPGVVARFLPVLHLLMNCSF